MDTPRILIVDDNALEHELFQEAVNSLGWDVVLDATTRLGDAWTRLIMSAEAGHRPDLVILDVLLHGKSSVGFLDDLRANPLVSDVPVVVLSNMALPVELHDQYRALGILRVLTKAKDFGSLTEFVRQVQLFVHGMNSGEAALGLVAQRSE